MTELNLMCEAVKFQKTVTDSTFEVLSILQNSSNDAMQQSLEQCFWLPEETRKDYNQWISYSRSASDDLKKNIDDCYQRLEHDCALWDEENGSPTEEIIAEAPLIKTEAAVTGKASAVKTKGTAKSTDRIKGKRNSTTTKTEKSKASPATAVLRNKKKPASKTQSARKKAVVKKDNSLTEASSKAGAAEVRKEVVEVSPIVKAVAPATDKFPVDRNVNQAIPLIVEKKAR